VQAKTQMAVAAHPLAAHAARDTLRQGGSAVDAAIAAQLVLNLVEPQSSGLGGGGFLVHWDANAKKLATYDGRETAPKAAKPDRFIQHGRRMDFYSAMKSARSVGVPGLIRMLEMAHAKHGRLPWADLFKPAIKLAETGFPVGKRLHKLLRGARGSAFSQLARAYFFDEFDDPWPVGHMLKNPALAMTLRTLASQGADAFYRGPIAEAVVTAINAGRESLNDMTLGDFAAYRAKERPPVCAPYRAYNICGMGPPSSGALTIAYVLRLLEPFDLGREPLNPDALHLISEAQKLAYADRRRYMADADFVPVPKGLLEKSYLTARRKLIDATTTMRRAEPGNPPGVRRGAFGQDGTFENSGTTHISIIDRDGNAVSMTTTIESAFGSGLMAGGFLLNNELTDFSFSPTDAQGRPVANRVEGGKRPRSSMSPTIVFDKQGNVRMVLGSPGGSRIILYVLKTLIAHLDWGLGAQDAVSLPTFGSRNGPFEIEAGPWSVGPVRAMRARGHSVRVSPMTSGLALIIAGEANLEGGADPRREGVALGD
jgi:gamma-glutamyltranspeptidase/glutathione hydrolase